MRTSVEEEIDEYLDKTFARAIRYNAWILVAYFILASMAAAWLLFTSIRLHLVPAEGEAATEKLLRLNLISSFSEVLAACSVVLVVYFILSVVIGRISSQVFFKTVYSPSGGLLYLKFSETYSGNIYRRILWLALAAAVTGAAIAILSSQSDQDPVSGLRWVLLGFAGGSIGIYWFEKLRAMRFSLPGFEPGQSSAIESIAISEGLNSVLIIVVSFWVIASVIAPNAGRYLDGRITQRDHDYTELVQEVIEEAAQREALIRRYRLCLADFSRLGNFMITGEDADWDTAGVVKARSLNVRRGPGLRNDVTYVVSSEYLTQVMIDVDSVKPADGYNWYRILDFIHGEGWAAGEFMGIGQVSDPISGEWRDHPIPADHVAMGCVRLVSECVLLIAIGAVVIPTLVRVLGGLWLGAFAGSVLATGVTGLVQPLLESLPVEMGYRRWISLVLLSVVGLVISKAFSAFDREPDVT